MPMIIFCPACKKPFFCEEKDTLHCDKDEIDFYYTGHGVQVTLETLPRFVRFIENR